MFYKCIFQYEGNYMNKEDTNNCTNNIYRMNYLMVPDEKSLLKMYRGAKISC